MKSRGFDEILYPQEYLLWRQKFINIYIIPFQTLIIPLLLDKGQYSEKTIISLLKQLLSHQVDYLDFEDHTFSLFEIFNLESLFEEKKVKFLYSCLKRLVSSDQISINNYLRFSNIIYKLSFNSSNNNAYYCMRVFSFFNFLQNPVKFPVFQSKLLSFSKNDSIKNSSKKLSKINNNHDLYYFYKDIFCHLDIKDIKKLPPIFKVINRKIDNIDILIFGICYLSSAKACQNRSYRSFLKNEQLRDKNRIGKITKISINPKVSTANRVKTLQAKA